MKIRNDPFSRLTRFLLTVCLTSTWCALPALAMSASAAAPAGPTPGQLNQLADNLEQLYPALEAADKAAPRDTFDPIAVADQVGQDPALLLKWVHDQTLWIPYHGELRGPMGVLLDRQGNSLDRSLLLAEMLRYMRHEVRLAHGTLPAAQAAQWIAPLLNAKPLLRPLPANDNSLQTIARQYHIDPQVMQQSLDRNTMDVERSMEDLIQRTSDQTTALLHTLVAPPASAQVNLDRAEAIDCLTDHWWIQMKDDQQKWIDLDPLSPDSTPGKSLATASETFPMDPATGKIDPGPDRRHEVVIRVVVEQWTQGKLSTHTVLSHSLFPADLYGQAISFINTPLDQNLTTKPDKSGDPQKSLRDAVTLTHEWLPTLAVGEESFTQGSVRDDGTCNDKPDLGLFAGTKSATISAAQAATDALGGAFNTPTPPEPTRLTAEWMEYEIHTPGQSPQIIQRQVFDLIGPAARNAPTVPDPGASDSQHQQIGCAMLGQVEILAIPSPLSDDLVAHLVAHAYLAGRSMFPAFLRKCAKGNDDSIYDDLLNITPLPSALYGVVMARQTGHFSQNLFMRQINIFALHHVISSGDDKVFRGCNSVDIVFNPLAVRAAATAASTFHARVEQGVLDTNAELSLATRCTPTRNTADLFSEPSNWVTLRSPDDPALKNLALDADSLARITQDLRDGNTVVAPQKAINGIAAWWRVDPKTGQTLGISSNGWGDAAVEEGIILWRVTVKAAIALLCLGVTISGSSSTGGAIAGAAVCAAGFALGGFGVAGQAWFGAARGVAGVAALLGDLLSLGSTGYKLTH